MSSATSDSSVEMRCCMDDADSVAVSGEFEGLVWAFADAATTTRRTIAVFSAAANACESRLVRMSGWAVWFLTTSSSGLAVLRECEEALMCESAYAEGHKETDRFC